MNVPTGKNSETNQKNSDKTRVQYPNQQKLTIFQIK